eukprot:g23382.t1
MVVHATEPTRVMEEADVLSIVLSKVNMRGHQIEFLEFKAVLLASLRSLLPKTWNSECEVAWTWLWGSFERMLPRGITWQAVEAVRGRFSVMWAPRGARGSGQIRSCLVSGQDYFKQSSTRLHFIADRMINFTQEIFKDPKGVMTDLSALGLRHVGYGIPTELFGPFVSAAIEQIREITKVPDQEEAFRWSIGLISRVLCRTITEGSTLVMRAINANCAKMLRKAVSIAPRGSRAECMLKIQVGAFSKNPGVRRVNYFIKYLIVDAKSGFSESFRDVVDNGDPAAACHPSVVLAADLVWSRLASYTFLTSKLWFLLNLLVFVITQAVLTDYSGEQSSAQILAVFIGRIFIYIFGMGQLILRHMLLERNAKHGMQHEGETHTSTTVKRCVRAECCGGIPGSGAGGWCHFVRGNCIDR